MIIKSFYSFILFMEIMTITYIVAHWLFRIKSISKFLQNFLAPLLEPIEKLSKKSIMFLPIIELSPILLLVVLVYIEQILYKFL